MKNIPGVFFVFIAVLACACKREAPLGCIDTAIQLTITNNTPCASTVTVQVTPQLANLRYSLNGGAAVTTPDFRVTTTGNNTLRIIQEGCFKDTSFVIAPRNPGSLFLQVRNILQTNCSLCHAGLNPQAGLNFTDDCTITEQWQRIQARALLANPSVMPPAGLLQSADRAVLQQWIDNGHRFDF